jgi:RNA polymerase sigma factor (sigma-70 family)
MMLTDNQVKALWEQSRHDELVLELRGIAVSAASKLYKKFMQDMEADLDDVVSWALESLWEAILSWDPSRPNFNTLRSWAAFKIDCHIKNIMRDTTRQKRGGNWERVSITTAETMEDRLACGGEDTMLEILDAKKKVERLPGRQRLVLAMLAEGYTLREVGKVLDVSYETVRQDAKKARSYLEARRT